MMTTRDKSSPPDLGKQAWVAVSAIGALLVAMLVGTWNVYEQNKDISAILAAVELPVLVDNWTVVLDSETNEFEIGETLPFLGTFDCSERAISEDPLVQFNTSLREPNGLGVEIPRDLLPARNITATCSKESALEGVIPSPFGMAWTDEMIRIANEVITEPTVMVFRLSVASDGWQTASTISEEFIIILPPETPGPEIELVEVPDRVSPEVGGR